MGEEFLEEDGDDAKSRFTTYSMTSSVMRRTDGLQQVDDMFEKVKSVIFDRQLLNLLVQLNSF